MVISELCCLLYILALEDVLGNFQGSTRGGLGGWEGGRESSEILRLSIVGGSEGGVEGMEIY